MLLVHMTRYICIHTYIYINVYTCNATSLHDLLILKLTLPYRVQGIQVWCMYVCIHVWMCVNTCKHMCV